MPRKIEARNKFCICNTPMGRTADKLELDRKIFVGAINRLKHVDVQTMIRMKEGEFPEELVIEEMFAQRSA